MRSFPSLKTIAARIGAWPRLWGVLVITAATLPVYGVFSRTRIFFVRDLALQYWPRHLWLRRTILGGAAPWWEPHIGFGQSAIADPTHQLLYLPTLLIRLLLPAIIGFNLWVALPFPLAAWGSYLFLRRHVTPGAAALGAVGYALSGPVLSTGNMPNMSWSVMLIPWVLWALERLEDRRTVRCFVALALLFALQALAGEPVTLATTATLAVVYAATAAQVRRENWRSRVRLAAQTLGAGLVGLLLAAGQILPLVEAARRSLRSTSGQTTYYGTLHPLTLVETIAPRFFGNYLSGIISPASTPWLLHLNDGRDPFFISLYIGIGTLTLAFFGAVAGGRSRWTIFWCIIFFVALLCSLGEYTPLYSALQKVVPLTRSFRYPVKYSVVLALAVAALLAVGWDALNRASEGESRGRNLLNAPIASALTIALTAAVLGAVALGASPVVDGLFFRLGVAIGLGDPKQGVEAIAGSVPLVALRLTVLAATAGACLWFGKSARPEGRLARGILCGMIVLDLILTNYELNPTMNAALIGEPEWVAATRAHPGDRVFIGPKITGVKLYPPLDAPFTIQEAAVVIPSQLAYFPGAWNVREGLSTDTNVLWPREYGDMLQHFLRSDLDESARYLKRTGTRYYITRRPPPGESRAMGRLEHNNSWILYEGSPPPPRVSLVERAVVEPDAGRATARMFAPDYDPSTEVIIEREPPLPAGTPGAPRGEPAAMLTEDSPAVVAVRARIPPPGAYLVLMDSYDPNWRVEVDEAPATLLRADGLFRAVRLASGEHHVRFVYRPRSFLIGLGVSGLTALALVLACFVWRGRVSPGR